MHGDHFLEAFEQWESMGCPDYSNRNYSGRSNFSRDDKFYHTLKEFSSILSETEVHILYDFVDYQNVWIPKKICKSSSSPNRVWIHTEIFDTLQSEVF